MRHYGRWAVVLVATIILSGILGRGISQTRRNSEDGTDSRAITDQEWSKEVLQAKDVVLVDFWATWCGPCQEMKPIVKSLAKEFKVVMVDVDHNESLSVKHEVRAIPTVLIFKDGKVVRRFTGVTSEDTLRKTLKSLRQREGS